ncbi:hypothetical protein Hanom_Chr05g00449771 [Helianthus anomalus]
MHETLPLDCINIQMFPTTSESAHVVVAERWSWPAAYITFLKSRRGMFTTVYGCENVDEENEFAFWFDFGYKKVEGGCNIFYKLEFNPF